MKNGSVSTPGANAGGTADTSIEGSTDTENAQNNSTDRIISNDSTIKRLTGKINGQYPRSNPTVDTLDKAFEGAEPDIGCVLGLRFEKVDNKVA